MKAFGKSSNLTIVAMLVVVAVAVGFWMLLLSPKRDEAAKLGKEIEQVEASLAQHQAEVAEAEEARKQFPADYQQLVVLGKAVPGDDDVASLLVQMTAVSERADVDFRNIQLNSSGGEGEAAAASSSGGLVSPTEAEASLLSLGATIGPAGLAVMPYTINFNGTFFEVADFVKEIDSLVKTNPDGVVVNGRLVTIDGFSLGADPNNGFPALEASFAVTTYLTPPGESGLGEEAPETLGAETATPAATTTGGAP